VFAIYGSGKLSRMGQRIQRAVKSLPRQSRNAATAISARKYVPRPAMMW